MGSERGLGAAESRGLLTEEPERTLLLTNRGFYKALGSSLLGQFLYS